MKTKIKKKSFHAKTIQNGRDIGSQKLGSIKVGFVKETPADVKHETAHLYKKSSQQFKKQELEKMIR